MDIRIALEPHPTLRVAAFATSFPEPLGALATPAPIGTLLRCDVAAPLRRDEAVRSAVRDMLRHGGYRPTGRGKPAAEYLVRAVEEGMLGSINVAVDTCNAVSLHSGLPISVVDATKAQPPFRIGVAPGDARYVFNAAGQEIALAGLVCLFDTAGPCGNAVKDTQRTKTDAETRRTLSVVWGCAGHEERLESAVRWYRELLGLAGAVTEMIRVDAS